MAKKNKLSQEDLDLFLNAIKGTKRLQKNQRILPKKQQIRKSRNHFKETEEVIHLSENQNLTPVLSDELIVFKQTSVANKILRKLRKGQYNIEAILDLHGLSVSKAEIAVSKFLQQCLQKQIQVALIIHGKSYHSQVPILKNKLNHWLREINIVLAFCSATKEHGSRGAMYVLLKRKL